MKTERPDRRKTFNQMLNKSKNVVADELLFTATHKFFDNMSKEDIRKWADTCMEFVYKDLGYTKEQVLHATVHLDEETPHLHCVVIPLIKKFDKRTNTERYTISKKTYIKDKIHLSELQDKYHKRLTDKGYDLERAYNSPQIKDRSAHIIIWIPFSIKTDVSFWTIPISIISLIKSGMITSKDVSMITNNMAATKYFLNPFEYAYRTFNEDIQIPSLFYISTFLSMARFALFS